MRIKKTLKAFGLSLGSVILCLSSVASAQEGRVIPFQKGETINYVIKKFGVNAGKASLTFQGQQEKDGKKSLLVVFRAEAFNFFDEEKIYVDPKTFLPICVERDLNIFGKKEQIKEIYDQAAGLVTVLKEVKGKKSEQKIKKDGAIENIYGFIYRYRLMGNFTAGATLTMNLPTQQVSFTLKKEDSLVVAGQEYRSFLLESRPNKYRVWFGKGVGNIPLRIDGAMGLSSMSMIMENYQPTEPLVLHENK
jgi:hypothetical protein